MKKGFTLVELLGVIVVLAIVMGLAVVSVSSIIDKRVKYKNFLFGRIISVIISVFLFWILM